MLIIVYVLTSSRKTDSIYGIWNVSVVFEMLIDLDSRNGEAIISGSVEIHQFVNTTRISNHSQTFSLNHSTIKNPEDGRKIPTIYIFLLLLKKNFFFLFHNNWLFLLWIFYRHFFATNFNFLLNWILNCE